MALSQCIKRRHLAQKNFKFHAGVKKCYFGNFSERAGMAVPCQCGPQKCIIAFEKLFLSWVPMNIQNDWKAKLEIAYSFMLKYSKTTVCEVTQFEFINSNQVQVLEFVSLGIINYISIYRRPSKKGLYYKDTILGFCPIGVLLQIWQRG